MREDPLLIIVPARGGSKGIRRKVLQLVDGRPLLLHALELARASGVADRIVVSTEDPEIAAYAELHGAEVIARPTVLALDTTTILEVVAHAVEFLDWVGMVAVVQPTCPLLAPSTVADFIAAFRRSNFDRAYAGAAEPHIFWQNGGPIVPRVNRQWLKRNARLVYRETGLSVMTVAQALGGQGLSTMFEVPADEALDIDTPADLEAARRHLARRRILFEVAVGKDVGSGHLYRSMRLAESLGHHSVGVSLQGSPPDWAVQLLRDRGLWVEDWREYHDADLVIIDALDTNADMVCSWKAQDVKVITFEDEGQGARHADLVVNELLKAGQRGVVALYGPAYTVLRSEFLAAPPHHYPERGRHVLITFGGTDPARLNARVSKRMAGAGYDVRVMVGPGADTTGVEGLVVTGGNMAIEMAAADLVITGQGRTQYEAAAMSVPTITLAANERESRHYRCPGTIHLGLHATVGDDLLVDCVARVMANQKLRTEMGTKAATAVDGRGAQRIVGRIDALLGGLG